MKTGKQTRRQKWEGRPPDSVIQQRVTEMVFVLSNRPTVHRCQLHAEFCPRWQCHWKTVDKIEGRARKVLFERLRRSREDFRVESLAFYEAKINDKNATVAEQIRARQRVDELLGLDAPRRTEVSGPAGAPIKTEEVFPDLPPDRLRQLIAVLENGAANGEAKKAR